MLEKISNSEAKKIMINILSFLSEYCDNNGLRYFLAYGTLLGAIRHKGFIPWDNDIDIWMPRPDYDKFRELVILKPINENIRCLDYCTIKAFPFLKVFDYRTILKEHFLVTGDKLGLYVDVFPLDGLPENVSEKKRILSIAEKYNRCFALGNYRFNTGSNGMVKLLKNVFYPFSRLMDSKKICQRLDTLCAQYAYDQSMFVGNVVWGYGKKEILKKTWFGISTAEFEGKEYKIPSGYDEILKNYYGEYMTLPPKEKRIVHYYDAIWR